MNAGPGALPPAGPGQSPGLTATDLCAVGDHSIGVNRLAEAAWCFERAHQLAPSAAAPLAGLAKVRHLQGAAPEARALMEQAIAQGATDAQSHTILGQICQSLGDFPAAIAAFERAVVTDPAHGPAWLRLALLPGSGDPAPRIAAIERIRTRVDLTTDQRATLNFALGRDHETRADYAAAFAAYREANEIRHAQYPQVNTLAAQAESLIALYSRDFIAARAGIGDPSPRPVFIVGMMRAGTTLIEQILDSHPAIAGLGERTEIPRLAAALDPVTLTPKDAANAAAAYLARLPTNAPRAIDKLPHNFQHLGLIALLFPNAQVIHCIRDKRDVCLANYVQDFGPLNPHTYDLTTLADYHRAYTSLMRHWHEVLPLKILDVRYEDLVANQVAVTRRLIAFLGLEWDDACLAFETNPRPIYTKSLWQVRQKLYPDGIGRWRHFADGLAPLLTAL
jgi:tetratricopeptide (TPR) repeat protein